MADGEHNALGVHWPNSGPGRTKAVTEVNVITEARRSYDEEFRARKKRYVIMMAMRLPCLIAAAVLYQTPWLAVLIILISIPLPWMAVLIANDGPARKTRRVPRGRIVNDQHAITGATTEVVDGVPGSRGDG
ncbi:MAG: DUF3099 domain-containing protein [Nakamurella sp.]